MADYQSYNPVKPSEIAAVIPNTNDSVFIVLLKYIRFMILFYKWFCYFFDNEGNINAKAQKDICNAIERYKLC